jgi:hypothetical protein
MGLNRSENEEQGGGSFKIPVLFLLHRDKISDKKLEIGAKKLKRGLRGRELLECLCHHFEI